MSEVQQIQVPLHIRVARVAGVRPITAKRYLAATPKRVDYEIGRCIVLALRQLNEPIPACLAWAVEYVDVAPVERRSK